MNGYICIHGHFYQPPRENPWLERIEVQNSAYPYHDWNARVHAECYAPNAVSRIMADSSRISSIVNNYEHISFDFGPTLLAWIEQHDPDIYRKIIQADTISTNRHGGHGNAIAQPYNHMIMPLANRRDKLTQVVWGISFFRKHFGRAPEGMWLPETAVDLETLEILHDQGIRFTLLAPRQARRVRSLDAIAWHDVADGSIDTSMPYLVRLPCGGSMAVFFYHGEIAHDLAFGGLLKNAEAYTQKLFGALPTSRVVPPLVSVATDGETYGHHHRFGDMALAFALDQVQKNPDVELTNYGEYLSLFEPAHEVEIIDKSSWSCVHGVERWRSDCGCKAGGHGDWNQRWRHTLRESLDWLRYGLISLYGSHAARVLKNPWRARDEYIDVIMERTETVKATFLKKHAVKELSAQERSLAFQLLEMQRNAMLMYTSCGWFFDEMSGLEAVQVLCYAGRAVELAERCSGESLELEFIKRLKLAQSNIKELGTGADVYRKFALAHKAHLQEVAIHFAISSFFEEYRKKNTLGCYTIELQEYDKQRHNGAVAATGILRTKSTITEEEDSFLFAALQQNPHDFYCAMKEFSGIDAEAVTPKAQGGAAKSYAEFSEVLFSALKAKGPSAALKVIDQHLGSERYSIKDMFKDEQEELLDIVMKEELDAVEKTFDAVYTKTAFLTALLKECGHRIPAPFTVAAEVALKRKLIFTLENQKTTPETMRLLLDEISRGGVTLDQAWLERVLRGCLEKAMARVNDLPEINNIKQMNGLLAMLDLFPVRINLWQVQNTYFELLKSRYPVIQEQATGGDPDSGKWIDEFMSLGSGLSINVENVVTSIATVTALKASTLGASLKISQGG